MRFSTSDELFGDMVFLYDEVVVEDRCDLSFFFEMVIYQQKFFGSNKKNMSK